MKILVTGASGFIGRALIRHALSQKADVYALGRVPVDGVRNILLSSPSDIRSLRQAVREASPELIFHAAGSATANTFSESMAVNALYCADLFQALKKEGLWQSVKILVFGSAAEYGFVGVHDLPISERLCPRPSTIYGIAKLAQTQYALSCVCKEFRPVIVRPFTVLGPGMPSHLAIGSFIEQIQSARHQEVKGKIHVGNLETSRDFLDVRDAARLCWSLVLNEDAGGRVVNLCAGAKTRIRDMLNFAVTLADADVEIVEHADRLREHDMLEHYGDNRLLKSLVSYTDPIPWRTTIREMLVDNA